MSRWTLLLPLAEISLLELRLDVGDQLLLVILLSVRPDEVLKENAKQPLLKLVEIEFMVLVKLKPADPRELPRSEPDPDGSDLRCCILSQLLLSISSDPPFQVPLDKFPGVVHHHFCL